MRMTGHHTARMEEILRDSSMADHGYRDQIPALPPGKSDFHFADPSETHLGHVELHAPVLALPAGHEVLDEMLRRISKSPR